MPNDSLEQRVEDLENLVYSLLAPGVMTIQNNVQVFDGRTIQVGKKYGTMIGTEPAQKLAFYGLTPISQYRGTVFNANAGATYGANEEAMLTGLKNALLAYGLVVSS